jgi:GH15 family glucan-1,4-alpha-glucosidase
MRAGAMADSSLDLGVIGNCSYAALIDGGGRIVWGCMPAFDGDPVFNHLLNEGADHGFFDVVLEDGVARSEQAYLRNTAILRTDLYDAAGNGVRILDFVPRFAQFGRRFRPPVLVRILEPRAGAPRLRIRLRPSFGYGATRPDSTFGSNHIRYIAESHSLRLTTNAPIPYVLKEQPLLLRGPITLFLGPDEPLTDSVSRIGREFIDQTADYWRHWVRSLNIPLEWQEAVIRSAITLKLCSYEPTGALIAALTTSIPEAAGSRRNWDYRYCWLRDAYFTVQALNQTVAHQTMEDFLRYIDNLVASAPDGSLQPVYGITLEPELPEREVPALAGYRGMGPVRAGNQAYAQIQHDVYGHVVLASTQAFFDTRLLRPGDIETFHRLEALGAKAYELYDKPDAGMWERRTSTRVHTSSSLMCWAACDRLAKIAAHLGLADRAVHWRTHADTIHAAISARAWSATRNSFVATFDGDEVDANLLLLEEIGFLAGADPRFVATVEAVERELRQGPHVFRYKVADDFGRPENAFVVCSFWYINALAALGRHDEARALFEKLLDMRNSLGLLSEHIDPTSNELWGNFPQTYSHVGLINCAFRLSRPWTDAR